MPLAGTTRTGQATSDGGGGPAVELREVTKTYGEGAATRRVLGPVSLSVEVGRFVAVMGPSGSGKSTLLHVTGGLVSPSSGDVLVGGRSLNRLDGDGLADLRRHALGFVFQSFNLVPVLTVAENVALPATIAGRRDDRSRRRVAALLELVGLTEQAGQRPESLSGGEQQRAALARALVMEPTLLLADEPTGSLDSASGAEVIGLLRRLTDELGQTLVLVTHDPGVAAAADEVILIRDGAVADRLVLSGPGATPGDPERRRRAVLSFLDAPVAAGQQ
jgi:putative ABC transport system ATP-binding protein